MSFTPDLGELLAEAVASARGSVRTALPATIIDYDRVTQTATVKPSISGRYQDPDTDLLVPYPMPQIPNVPIAFPSGTGFSITWDLVPGDLVYLVVSERSIDEWKTTGAPENVPVDVRRFDLTDAVAFPNGPRPLTRPIPPTGYTPGGLVVEAPRVLLGSSAAVSKVVLETLLAPFLATVKGWLDLHIHSGVTTGAGSSGPPVAPSPSPPGIGAAKVFAE